VQLECMLCQAIGTPYGKLEEGGHGLKGEVGRGDGGGVAWCVE
jgi:hypothetical protein